MPVELIGRLVMASVCLAILLLPAWWIAGRIQEQKASPLWRLLWAVGLALVGWLSFVNLAGRLFENSTAVSLCYLGLNLLAGILIWRRWPAEASGPTLASSWRSWIGPVALALLFGLPQWLVAVSTNFFDEAASSAIHLSAANQFAEGVFPPRHNAFPDVVIKYHYGFTILSGTVRWLTGLSANVSVDVVSTLLWLFVFLFLFCWFRELGFGRFATFWGAFASLLGGGLGWMYLPRIEAYGSVYKQPPPELLRHRWDAGSGWLENLLSSAQVASMHLRNLDGSLSHLPWNMTAEFQQHAVPVGLALTVFALALFVAWQRRPQKLDVPLLAANVACFGVLALGHAAFGAMAALTAGLWLLVEWLRRPSRVAFLRGLYFGIGVAGLTLLHGGLFARGPQYGGDSVATWRDGFGYPAGGAGGFFDWNLAGFGLPLVLALVAWGLHRWHRDEPATDRNILFGLLTVLAIVSWCIPQVMFYSSDTLRSEQFTEIAKFFFITRLALALLSAYGVAYLVRSVHWAVLLPGLPAMALIPLAFVYSIAVGKDHSWVGFYRAPYHQNSIEQQMGEALFALKQGPMAVYFDASADERKHGYLSEMLVYGGSVFTLTPSRYERTGGYRLAEDVIARRLEQNGRMARLQPGAAEACDCEWYYTQPAADMTLAPVLVRSRFEKLVAEGTFEQRFEAKPRALYSIEGPTTDLDVGLERHWRPKIVSQPSRNQALVLRFYDRVNHQILTEGAVLALPEELRGESLQLYTGRFFGDARGIGILIGRMRDTRFRLGKWLEDLVEWSGWGWTFHAAEDTGWRVEYPLWSWNWEIPFVADIDADGYDAHLAFRPGTGVWFTAPKSEKLSGPAAEQTELPLPFGGRFLEGSRGDLGVWKLAAGTVTLRSVDSDQEETFKWGGQPGDVLVPGDYDGDGRDEIAVWQQSNQTWYWRKAPAGPISQATFGTPNSLPVPADYSGDGQLDLAYWEDGKIFVSYDQGRSVDRVIPVPPGSIPIFVNMN